MYQDTRFKTLRQKLRNNPTEAERKLWSALRNKQILGYKFVRQYGVNNFVLDFYCPILRLAVELDGSRHMEEGQKCYDEKRAKFLNSKNIQIARFYDNEVLNNLEGVIEKIIFTIKSLR
jgi:very-short-patch-repair endonuclease